MLTFYQHFTDRKIEIFEDFDVGLVSGVERKNRKKEEINKRVSSQQIFSEKEGATVAASHLPSHLAASCWQDRQRSPRSPTILQEDPIKYR